MTRCEIRLKNETLAVLDPYLITRGVPMPPGAIKDPRHIVVRDANEKVLPSAAKVLQRRGDGSIEWALLDILVSLTGQQETSIYVEPKRAKGGDRSGAPIGPALPPNAVVVREKSGVVTLSNGITTISVNRKGGSLINRLVINGRVILDPETLVDLEVVDPGGKIYRASLSGPYRVSIPHQNPLRTEVRIDGTHTARDGSTLLDFALRFTLIANSPDLKLEHTFYCHEKREGKINVRAIRLVMPTRIDPSAVKMLRQQTHGVNGLPRHLEIAENIEVVASSSADIDNYAQTAKGAVASHPSAGGAIFLRNANSIPEDLSQYPFHMRPGSGSGFRADLQVGGTRAVAPTIGWKEPSFTLVTTFEHFRQLHPKSIAIDENVITYSIWPEWSTPLQVVQGVSKSHIFWITGERRALKPREVDLTQYRWEYGYVEPVDISFDPAWPAYCQVLDCQHVLRHQPQKYPLLENLIEPAPGAGNPARHTYDRWPAIGMFHFGDLVKDNAALCKNNEDDRQVYFPLQHFLRTGQTYAWDHGKEGARHYMEVDFCERSTDPRQDGGLIAHTGQHFVGNVYPSHQWSEGLLAYYYLSGDERARNVVECVGDNCCYWAYHETHMVCCDGREAGMPLVNLAAAYRLTRKAKYIQAAKHIVKNFVGKNLKRYGALKYPTIHGGEKIISGYGDFSTFAGLYRLWEVTGDALFKRLAIQILDAAIRPARFSVNDTRNMDFFGAWILGTLTNDMDAVVKRIADAIPMLLRRGGHEMRRLHFLKVMDERGLIDEKQVGTRPGVIG